MPQPNILIFIPHDLGDYLGCYGHPSIESPNIDQLAERGMRFSNYFTPAPECTPSRSSMMTGLYTHQNGLMGLSNFGWSLKPDVTHLAEHFRRAGYESHLFGFQHETHHSPTTLGYKHWHAQDDIGAANVCQELANFLRTDSAHDGPWFTYAGFSHVHRPWPDNRDFSPGNIRVPPYLPDHPVIRKDIARFHQSILDMDRAVGNALQALREADLEEETIVIFTTDHGPAFPHAKATFYDPGIRIPLIMHWPGHIEGDTRSDELLSNIDFTPTVLDLCGQDIPNSLAGRSFAPLLSGGPYTERDAVYGALYYDVSYDPMHYVRTRTHKYIRSFATTPCAARDADDRVLATHEAGKWIRVDDLDVMTGPTWQVMQTKCDPPSSEEFYDLNEDPLEMNNLVSKPQAESVLKDMRVLMENMMHSTNSPLLHGHVQPPEKQIEAAVQCRPGSSKHSEKASKRWDLVS